MNLVAIIQAIDNYLVKSKRQYVEPAEANAMLEKSGLLSDSKDRPGKPLRNLLRKGLFPHAYQEGGKGSGWRIPRSSQRTTAPSNFPTVKQVTKRATRVQKESYHTSIDNPSQIKQQLQKARLKYKPGNVKYLLVAEAPPDTLERFFYYENVREHDYLFLGVAEALYPELKAKFIASRRNSEIKRSILEKLKADGFYLLDLSELPLSVLNDNLPLQVPKLIESIHRVASEETQIILIKATVYDAAFHKLREQGFKNVIDKRIPFPGNGGQKDFQIRFRQALVMARYF